MKNKKLDIVGILCGLFLVVALVANIVLGNINAENMRPKIPETAQTIETTARGIFSDVKVETVADADGIYSVKVIEHGETPEIGGVAAEELPARIVEAQSVEVDGNAGATMTSNAIKAAVTEALVQVGFLEAPAEEAPAEEAPAEEAPAEETAAAAEGAQTVTVTKPGVFGEDVVVEVVADAGQIYSVTVVENNETMGIGSMAVDELPGKIVEAQSAEIDGVSGATMTSNAIKAAVAEALEQVGFGGAAAAMAEEAPAEEAPAEETAAAEGAQTVTVTKPGVFGEDVVVEVVADASTIYSVTVVKNNETMGIGSMAVDELPGKIVEAQSAEIDGVSGATMTSNAIKAAVAEALEQIGFVGGAAAPAGEAQTVTVTKPGVFGEDVVVEVVADAGTIYSVTVVENNETMGIGSMAVDELPGKIVEAQSAEIDGVSGATMTSNAIKAAVAEALEQIGFVGGGAAAVPAEAVEVEKTPVELECDVVVVGAGGAGLTATVRATQEGAKVLVVEKMGMVGGNSLRAEGGMNAANTHYEAELGLTDSTVENYIEDTLRLGHYLADPELVRTLEENGAEAIEWLDSIGAPLPEVEATGGAQGRKYLHKPEGGLPVGEYLVDKLKHQIADLGVEVMLKTRATEILMEDGQAVGVIAEDAEHIYTIRAKAVVLATGGFGANFELMSSFNPSLANAVTTNHAGATGDGIALAEAVGAATVDMEQIQLHPTVIQSNGLLVSESLRSHGAILVNAEGKRFVNDMDGRDVVSQAELKQPGAYAFIIFDQKLVDEVKLTHKFIAGGYTVQGDTYEELGQAMGLEGEAVQNFVQQMETWNASVAEGEDKDFGRKGVDQDLSVAPFYAIKIAPGIHHTMGGIKINTLAQVISTEGEVIPGLFACGETTGGIHGGNRVGGNAVADFTIFGRIAGQNAAAYAAGEQPAADEPAGEAPAEEAPVEPQTVTVTKPGVFGEDVEVEVVADASTIYSVTVVENNETMGIGSMAVDELPGKIVEAQSAEVDGVSGATMTSNAIKAAVAEALEQIGFGAAPAEEAPAEEAPIEPQTVTVTKPGVFGEDVVVEVVADASTIYSVTVVKNNETMGIGSMAVDELPGKIVEAQSAEVDGVSGATMTSNAIKAAVAEALEQIGFAA